ncbi:MAG: protein-glutamate O-methyltransferase CheR [Deltaproteobacteria bacterium]|nr:protein-glutamate O-methyltransferase CheR [Deltaproteobacteria bacterium]
MMISAKEDLDNIRNLIKSRCGIWLAETKMNFLTIRLAHRLKVTGMETPKDYCYYLKYDPGGDEELNQLIDAVTVNETYFFRDLDQLSDFSEEIVPAMMKNKREWDSIRIWSAGCSTGEEPYTLAMLLLEHSQKIDASRISIIASDISDTVLRAAREGIYDDYSVRYVSPWLLLKYFDKDRDGRYVLKETVKTVVKFAHINLMDPFATGRVKEMDCIFCRNVILYFDDDDKEKCTQYLYRGMNKGGHLVLGRAESLGRISNLFDVVRLKRTTVYGKSGS